MRPMDIKDLLTRFAVALGIGLLIGIERGWRLRDEAPGSRTAGIRTFTISALLGGALGAFGRALPADSMGAGLVFGLGFAAYAAVFAAFCYAENKARAEYSATTAIAGLVTFVLGGYALVGDIRISAAVAVAAAVLLAIREIMHRWVEQITWEELRSGLVLLAMTFVALPVVPDDPIGPFGGVNPREIWVIAIVLAGVSFLGYAAVRYFGIRHGILLAAAVGGLVSSTAVTATNARRAAAGEGAPRLLAAGVALATAISFLRVMSIVAVLKPVLLWVIAPALAAAAAVAASFAAIAVYGIRASGSAGETVGKFSNPFGFFSVIGFAIFLGAIIVLGRGLGEYAGSAGAILGAAAVGLADVDAITVSMSRLVPAPLSLAAAGLAILAAVTSNTLVKVTIGVFVGRGRFAAQVAGMALLAVGAGALAYWMARLAGMPS
jgi:uncharacterized membrane protein (DUF4010 family)